MGMQVSKDISTYRSYRSYGFDLPMFILDILTYRSYGKEITKPYIINKIFGINYPQQGARITPTSVPSNVSVGEMEKKE